MMDVFGSFDANRLVCMQVVTVFTVAVDSHNGEQRVADIVKRKIDAAKSEAVRAADLNDDLVPRSIRNKTLLF